MAINSFVYLDDVPVENLFGSHPSYDEAYGPWDPSGDRYVPVGEIPEWCTLAAREDAEERERRLHWQDPDEPLGEGETVDIVREQARLQVSGPLITVDPEYRPVCEPSKAAHRRFKRS